MTVNRRMDEPEFKKLLAEEGAEAIPIWTLKPIAFNPPGPGEDWPEDPYKGEKYQVIFLNVLAPAFYKDDTWGVVVVLPNTQSDDMDYDYMADVHKRGDTVWGYRIAPMGWDADDDEFDLDDVSWFMQYEDEEIPPFEADRTETH